MKKPVIFNGSFIIAILAIIVIVLGVLFLDWIWNSEDSRMEIRQIISQEWYPDHCEEAAFLVDRCMNTCESSWSECKEICILPADIQSQDQVCLAHLYEQQDKQLVLIFALMFVVGSMFVHK